MDEVLRFFLPDLFLMHTMMEQLHVIPDHPVVIVLLTVV